MTLVVKKQFVARDGEWIEIPVGGSSGGGDGGDEVAIQTGEPSTAVDLWVDLDAPVPADSTPLQLYSSGILAQTGAPDINPYTASSVTLTPGSWIVTSGVCVYNATTSDSAWGCLWDSVAGVIGNSAGAAGMTTIDVNQAVEVRSAPTLVQVQPGSTKVVHPCALRNGSSSLMVVSGAAAPSAFISAIRVGLL